MEVFGYSTIAQSPKSGGHFNYGNLFTCPRDGTIGSMKILVTPTATTNKLKVAIYDSNKTLLSSGELNPLGSTTKQFYTIPIDPIVVSEGTQYYLSAGAANLNGAVDDQIYFYHDDTEGSWIYSSMAGDTSYANLWENPWTNEGSGTNRKMSFEAIYSFSLDVDLFEVCFPQVHANKYDPQGNTYIEKYHKVCLD